MPNQNNFATSTVGSGRYLLSRTLVTPASGNLLKLQVPADVPDTFYIKITLYDSISRTLRNLTTISSEDVGNAFEFIELVYNVGGQRNLLFIDFSKYTDGDIAYGLITGRFQVVVDFLVEEVGKTDNRILRISNTVNRNSVSEVELELIDSQRTTQNQNLLKKYTTTKIPVGIYATTLLKQLFNQNTFTKVAVEHHPPTTTPIPAVSKFTLTKNTVVFYGANLSAGDNTWYFDHTKYASKELVAREEPYACTNLEFGDPLVGTVKACYVMDKPDEVIPMSSASLNSKIVSANLGTTLFTLLSNARVLGSIGSTISDRGVYRVAQDILAEAYLVANNNYNVAINTYGSQSLDEMDFRNIANSAVLQVYNSYLTNQNYRFELI